MAEKEFRFRLKIQGKEAGVVSAITPPIDVKETFGTRGRVSVRGTINGFPFRSSLMSMGGCHMMPVNKALCDGARVGPGDIVDVVMKRDLEERTVEAPPTLQKELAKNKKAQREVGEAFFHAQEGDDQLDQRREARGDTKAAVGQSHAGAEDGSEVDRVDGPVSSEQCKKDQSEMTHTGL